MLLPRQTDVRAHLHHDLVLLSQEQLKRVAPVGQQGTHGPSNRRLRLDTVGAAQPNLNSKKFKEEIKTIFHLVFTSASAPSHLHASAPPSCASAPHCGIQIFRTLSAMQGCSLLPASARLLSPSLRFTLPPVLPYEPPALSHITKKLAAATLMLPPISSFLSSPPSLSRARGLPSPLSVHSCVVLLNADITGITAPSLAPIRISSPQSTVTTRVHKPEENRPVLVVTDVTGPVRELKPPVNRGLTVPNKSPTG